jgi:hypothetical protein
MGWWRIVAALALLPLLLLPQIIRAEGLDHFTSLQGYTGLLNIPGAGVTEEGTIDLVYSNQIEPQWRQHGQRTPPFQDNYFFSLGVFRYLEGGIRLFEAPGQGRDLSANFKLQVPAIPRHLPQLAIGVQDVAGGAPHLRTTYAVMSQELAPLRLSLGYGRGPDRLDGPFGGIELRLARWLYLLAEHDTHRAAAGLRLRTPPRLLPAGLSMGLALRAPLQRLDEVDFAVNLQIPLSPRPISVRQGAQAEPSAAAALHAEPRQAPPAASPGVPPGAPVPHSEVHHEVSRQLAALRRRLAACGFENIQVGSIGNETFYLEFENSRFNHNELDGLGVALGTVLQDLPVVFNQLVVRLKNSNLPVFELAAPVEPLRAFFFSNSGSAPPASVLARLRASLQASPPAMVRPAGLVLAPTVGNPQRGHSVLVLHPGLDTTVGTEYGVFDYRLSLKADLFNHLWTGAMLNSRADFPLTWSDNFAPGGRFHDHNDPVLQRLLFSQTFRLAPALTSQVGAGLYQEQVNGVLSETIWSPGDGRHRFRLRLGHFDPKGAAARHSSGLASYRLYVPGLDLALEATAGRFYGGDEGVQIELKRYFADTYVSAVFTETDERIVAFRISFPLTPRRDLPPGLLQVRGSERFTYELQSVLAERGGSNPLVFGQGEIPQTAMHLERAFFNGDRLNRLYLLEHLPRLREAYLRFGTEKSTVGPTLR